MDSKNRWRGWEPLLSDERFEDDGIDPRTYFDRRTRRQGEERKSRMLCAQVAECLRLVVAAEIRDPALEDLEIVEVLPTSVGGRLEVRVVTDGESAAVRRALDRAGGRLREAVAAAITRRRVPELTWTVWRADDV